MTSKALEKIYFDLDVKCLHCEKVVKLYDLATHEVKCGKTKCWNHDICSGYEDDGKNYGAKNCSDECKILEDILKANGNLKKMHGILAKYQPKDVPMGGVQVVNNPGGKSGSGYSVSSASNNSLKWNNQGCGQGLQFENNGTLVMLREPAYVFRTALTSTGFNGGAHYWEIIPDPRTENELKIGVATTNSFDLNTAFCDHVFGFAYYGLLVVMQVWVS